MRVICNLAISACLLTLVAVNMVSNPFLPQALAQESPCEGAPPNPDCICCGDCDCWVCP